MRFSKKSVTVAGSGGDYSLVFIFPLTTYSNYVGFIYTHAMKTNESLVLCDSQTERKNHDVFTFYFFLAFVQRHSYPLIPIFCRPISPYIYLNLSDRIFAYKFLSLFIPKFFVSFPKIFSLPCLEILFC